MKKRSFLAIIIAMFAIWSCSNTGWQENELNVEPQPQTTSMIEGVKVPNPYSVEAMKAACEVLYPTTRSGESVADEIIVATHIYVRFLPADKEQMDFLLETGWELFNYPLDVEFEEDPSEYHDPSLSDEQITWQYTVLPIDTTLPTDITYEILEECYIPDDDETEVETTAGTIVDIAAIEGVSVNYAETGVMDPSASTMALTRRTYTGTITVDGYPVEGIKVRIVGRLLSKTATTHADGTYSVTGRLGTSPKTEICFVNSANHISYGYNLALIMPTKVNIGTARSINFTETNNLKGWILSHMNRATCMYYDRCAELGLTQPPFGMRMWAIKYFEGASCPMFAHRTSYYINSLQRYVTGCFDNRTIANATERLLKNLLYKFGPDICLCDVESEPCASDIYEYVFHELSHATHFSYMYNNAQWWANVIDYELDCILASDFEDPYGTLNTPNNGHSGVAEMWAHAVGNIFLKELFEQIDIRATSTPYPPREDGSYWFKPEIIWGLYLNGVPLSTLLGGLKKEATSIQMYKQLLLSCYPQYTYYINQTFSQYGF
ncbi:MAG: hypothetical protein E7134_01670 [Rikenellaceae bacterium]|nr:hypothetical protein [Rikenellaceae bacterium]